MDKIDWYYVDKHQQRIGPVSEGGLVQAACEGNITPNSLVWNQGMEEWQPVKNLPVYDMLQFYRADMRTGRLVYFGYLVFILMGFAFSVRVFLLPVNEKGTIEVIFATLFFIIFIFSFPFCWETAWNWIKEKFKK